MGITRKICRIMGENLNPQRFWYALHLIYVKNRILRGLSLTDKGQGVCNATPRPL